MKVVMFAWGNPSRGDDGVGLWFARRFGARVGAGFELVEDFQLQVEHLLDCREGELLLFIDARCDGGEDFRFEEISPCGQLAHTSHALTPAELLGCYSRAFAGPPPPGFQLSVPGRVFDLGQPMSPETLNRCEMAAELVDRLIEQPELPAWREAVASGNAAPSIRLP